MERKVEDVDDEVASPIEENDVAADQHMGTIWRWRRQSPLKIFWTGLQALLESGRERATAHQLFL
jgi:hypothetical protein